MRNKSKRAQITDNTTLSHIHPLSTIKEKLKEQGREMQTQDNTETCYPIGNRSTWQKTSPRPSKSKSIHQRIKLKYTNNKRPSKPNLPHVLEPSKLLLPTGFSKPCLLQLFGSYNSSRLHPPMNGSFQYFPTTPNSHFTLKMGVVSVWAINLSRIWRWRSRS